MSIIRWEPPPPINRAARYDWSAIAAALASKPGEWGLVAIAANPTLAGQMARHIREGRYDPMAAVGRFEAVARSVEGEHRVYARYVGCAAVQEEVKTG